MKNRGFSLIELLVALVMLAILASVALPSYRDSVRKSLEWIREDGTWKILTEQVN